MSDQCFISYNIMRLVFSLPYKLIKQLQKKKKAISLASVPQLLFCVSVSFFSNNFCCWTRTKTARWAAETWGSSITKRCLWSTALHHSSSQFHPYHSFLFLDKSIFSMLCPVLVKYDSLLTNQCCSCVHGSVTSCPAWVDGANLLSLAICSTADNWKNKV